MAEPPPGFVPLTAATVGLAAYSYLFVLWLNQHGHSPDLIVIIREWINRPLGIGEDFGVLAMAVLVVLAGYLLAEAAHRMTSGRFVLRVALRVLPQLLIAAALGGVAALLGARLVLVFAWPLAVGALFCLLVVPMADELRRWPVPSVAGQLVVLTALVLLPLGPLRVLGGFGSLAVLGELIFLARAHRIATSWSVALGSACLALPVVAEHQMPTLVNGWYPLAACYAVLLVLLATRVDGRVLHTQPVRWLAERGYPLMLLIGVIGYPLLSALDGFLPVVVALVVAPLLTGLGAETVHRCCRRLA
jgi:hypothetical protein